MKKLIVSLLAVAGMVACSNEHVVRQQAGEAIGFSGAFVDNATRADKADDPSITTATIEGFDVWGFMDSAEGVVFVDEDVTGTKGNFTYVNTQYWVPGRNYYFAALAPMNSPNVTETLASGDAAYYGLGTIKFNVTDGAEDLLYSAVGPIAIPAVITTVEPVKFQFHHMLSKVKFSFTNGFKNDNAFIDVKNIKMVVPETGTIDLAVADWWSTNQWVLGDTTKEIAFGNACDRTVRNGKQESDVERIILPADATQKYTVTFDVVLYQGTVKAYEGTKTVTIENVPFEIGKAYNLKAVLDASNIMADGTELLPIVFDVDEVKDWDYGVENENEYDIFGPESGDDESDEPVEPEEPAIKILNVTVGYDQPGEKELQFWYSETNAHVIDFKGTANCTPGQPLVARKYSSANYTIDEDYCIFDYGTTNGKMTDIECTVTDNGDGTYTYDVKFVHNGEDYAFVCTFPYSAA